MLDRLRRYVRRAAYFPTTIASMDERLQRLEMRVNAAADDSVRNREADSRPEQHPRPQPTYVSAPYPTLRREHVVEAVLYADRIDALSHVSPRGRIAEIGVAAGDYTEVMLNALRPEKFDAFDIFQLHHLPTLWGRSTEEWFQGRSHREFYDFRFGKEIAAGIMMVFEGDSSVLMAGRPDHYYDMIYIDGDHSQEGVLRDAEASVPKLKHNGLLVFNDYTMMDHFSADPYGIVPVVNELCVNRGWTVAYFALQHDLFCDIALRRIQ